MSDETEWKTIRVPKGVYENAKQRKEEHDVTWGEYVNPHAWHSVFDEPKETPDDASVSQSSQAPTDEIMRKLEQIETAQANTVNESLELAEDAGHDHERIMNRLDDLENTIPRKTVEELR